MPVDLISPAELEQLLSVYRISIESVSHADETPILPAFDATEYEELRPFIQERICQPGEIIVRENDQADRLYIIRAGRAAVIKGDLQSPTILGFRAAGGTIGEMAVLENQPRSATVVALDPMVLWEMDQQTLYQLFHQKPAFSIKMLGMMSSRLRKSDEQRNLEVLTGKQREEAMQRLREQVVRDPLTGLFNRRYLEETLTREIARARREGAEVGILMMDVDHFKKVNDTYGHPAGDAVLQTLARLIRKCIRAEDVPCRYGGEEFIVIMPGTPLPVICERAEAIRLAFQGTQIMFGENGLSATVSIGAAAFPIHGESGETVLTHADKALYRAKQSGRNQVVMFDLEKDG